MESKDRKQLFIETMGLDIDESVITMDILKYLDENGFFNKPAAIKYHGNYTGGLFDHSLEVTKTLVRMTTDFAIKWQNPRSPYIVGMFHDLCKIDDYVNENEGFKTVPVVWKHNDNKILKGHGDKSVMMLSQLMTLTEEEMLCIRFHMGAYETDCWNEYDAAIKKYETVLWTHTADMYASKVVGI